MKRGGPLRRRSQLERGSSQLKRSRLERAAGQLKRTAGPARRVPVKAINPQRRARLRAEQFADQAELCRSLPCCACKAPAPSDPAHVVSRGAGGKDRGNVVPLCRLCHGEQHDHGWARLSATFGLDAQAVAAELELVAYQTNEE